MFCSEIPSSGHLHPVKLKYRLFQRVIITSVQAQATWLKHARKCCKKNSGRKTIFSPDHPTMRSRSSERTSSLRGQLPRNGSPSCDLFLLAKPCPQPWSRRSTRCTSTCSTHSKRLGSCCTVQVLLRSWLLSAI